MSKQKNTQEEFSLNLKKIAIWVGIIIVGLWLITLFTLIRFPKEERGIFGDMFGSINALFSGLALAGIILTILLQRQELELQRQELKETKEELKRSANAQEDSERALRRQAENMKISAKLTALNTLVTYYSDLEERVRRGYPYSIDLGEIIGKKNTYVQRIEELLEIKELG